MSPQLGQGVNMALLDALALRDALRDSDEVEPALAAYGAARRRHVAIYQFWSRWLTPVFQSEADSVAWLRDRFNDLSANKALPAPYATHILSLLDALDRALDQPAPA